jgi:hypothetical protein
VLFGHGELKANPCWTGLPGGSGQQMAVRFVLSDHVSELMVHAAYNKLEDGTFSGRIPEAKGIGSSAFWG